MATGAPTGVEFVGSHGTQATASRSSFTLNSAAPTGRFRLAVCWANSTSASWNNVAGWNRVFDAAIGSLRCGIFWKPDWNISSTAAITFTLTASAVSGANGTDWEGVDGQNPFLVAPSAATAVSGTTGTTLTLPTLSPTVEGGVGLWCLAARFSSGGGSGTIDEPADLIGSGSVSTGGAAAGIYMRTHMWGVGDPPSRIGLRTPTPTGTKAFGISPTPAALAGIGMVLRPGGFHDHQHAAAA